MFNKWVAIVYYRTSDDICKTEIDICIHRHFKQEKSFVHLENYVTMEWLIKKKEYVESIMQFYC